MRQIILVCGYIKSGNTWLARLLGDALNSPVQGLPGQELGSLAAEGQDRPGNYCIIQAHELPENYYDNFTKLEINLKKIVVIIRHPFDVAVSASCFWEIPLTDTIDKMARGNWPFALFPSWSAYYGIYPPMADVVTKYEALSKKPEAELERILRLLYVPIDHLAIRQSVQNQSFDIKRAEIKRHPERYSYDRKAQLHNLRRGKVGDWRNHFNEAERRLALIYFERMMRRYNYDG